MQNRNNFVHNLRLSMPGFGARAPFRIGAIWLLVNGLPEAMAEGWFLGSQPLFHVGGTIQSFNIFIIR